MAIPFYCPEQRDNCLSCPYFAGIEGRYAKCEYAEKRYYNEKYAEI